MVDLIEFPTKKIAPDSLPDTGDAYEAFGLAQKFTPPMLTFIFPDRSMAFFRYDGIGMMNFSPLGADGDCYGEGMITLAIHGKAAGGIVVVITGRNLFDLFDDLGDHRVRWIWELPKDRAAAADGAAVVHSIEIKAADRRALNAILSQG